MRFKPSPAEQRRRNALLLDFYAGAVGKSHPIPEESVKRERKAPEDGGEGPVVRAIGELLRVHPCVKLAIRQNGGAGSYVNSDGRAVPVWFYQWVKPRLHPSHEDSMTVVDFWGFIAVPMRFIPFAIEAKRPDWIFGKSGRKALLREQQQERFINFIRNIGGRAGFARSADEAKAIIEGTREEI